MTLGIVFDNPNKTYTPGQIVTGKLICTFYSDQRVKGLKVTVTGLAHVRWEESRTESSGHGDNRTERRVTVVHQDYDKVFCYQFFAFGDGRTVINISSGSYEYPFQFTLPPGLPSSFVGSLGSVKYKVKASMKMTIGSNDKVKNDFLVNSILDLNTETDAARPADVKKSKTICCLCCASGPIEGVLKTPKIGFVPGECIPIEAEVQNNSSSKVNAVKFNLLQTCTYYAKSKKNTDTKLLVTVKRPGVRCGDSKVMREGILQVPTVPPTGLGNCRIIDVQYSLQMEVKIEGPSINLRVSTPIIIGTVPIGPSFVDVMPSNPAFNPSYNPTHAAISYYDQTPPTYSEAMAGAQTKF